MSAAKRLCDGSGQKLARVGNPRLDCMPSYRLELQIGDLRSGKAPNEVMDAALGSLGTHHVDATDIKVIDGTPLILVRFTVPASNEAAEDTAAQVAARLTVEAVERVAGTARPRLLRRRHGTWLPIG